MKIMLICSTQFYDKIPPIKDYLESKGFNVIIPNGYEEPDNYDDYDSMSEKEYYEFFKNMYYESREKINNIDAVLALNYTKTKNNQQFKNYVGASTFLELYEAFMQNKKIYLLNDIPDNMLYEEIKGFNPTILNENLDLIK